MLKKLFYASASVLPLALFMAPALPRAAVADCPTNSLSALAITQLSSNYSGSLAQAYTCTQDGFPVHSAGYAAYNLALGRVSASAQGGIECPSHAGVSTHDIFTLTGPASGTPISFRAELAVSVSFYFPYSGAGVTLREGTSNASSSTGEGFFTVGITVAVSPGSSFDLYMDAFAGCGPSGNAGASLDAVLGFPDLPPGYLLQSCQGFVAGGVVPVRAASWGKLKTLYR